jgi:uncharacterized protein YacL
VRSGRSATAERRLVRVRSVIRVTRLATKEGIVADWTTDAVDTLENVVAAVRDKTVVPAQKATKVVVFGLLVGFFVLMAVFMLAIALFRVLVVVTGEVWAAYLILGGIFVIAGAFVWTLRSRRNEETNA